LLVVTTRMPSGLNAAHRTAAECSSAPVTGVPTDAAQTRAPVSASSQ
jgi:hypothetical protein